MPRTSTSAHALNRDNQQTLTEQLSGRFAQRIASKLLAPGARLPSVRECARMHGVSPHTVVAAYDQLMAQGLIEARRQRGFFVREPSGASARPRLNKTATPPQPSQPVDATSLLRGMLYRPGAPAMPAFGALPPEWLDADMLGTALRRVTQGDRLAPLVLHYGEPAGDARLREALAGKLGDFGLQADAGQIVTTTGATQALDVVSRALLRPGDAVLVDEPGWTVEFARLTQLGMRILPVPRGPDGPDLAVMEQLARAHAPRLYVTVSVLHNPTSAMLSPGHAHQVLRLAERFDFHILEDDVYAWLAPAHATRLSVLDGLRRCVYVGSFSKILAPSWRVGYVAAPADVIERIVNAKLLSSLTTPPMPEQAVAWCLEQGLLRRHAERVVNQLDAARSRCVQLARQADCDFVTAPQGLFGWVDVGVNTERLTLPLLDAGWLIAPGALFHAQRRPTTLMRINYGTAQDARFWRALKATRARVGKN